MSGLAAAPGRGLAVPLYVHPVIDPQVWLEVCRWRFGAGLLVVNAANGPGRAADPVYQQAIGRLQAAGVPLAGYVDAGYGRRTHRQVRADHARWQHLYGVQAVFLDRVAASTDAVAATGALVRALKGAGAARVVLNPGVVPAPGLWHEADAVVTFEGRWAHYRHHREPGWLREQPPESVWHLVHTIPSDVEGARIAAAAHARGAGVVGLSHGTMPNAWIGRDIARAVTVRDSCEYIHDGVGADARSQLRQVDDSAL